GLGAARVRPGVVAVDGGYGHQGVGPGAAEGGLPQLLAELLEGEEGDLAAQALEAVDVAVEGGDVAVDLLGHPREVEVQPTLPVGEVSGRGYQLVPPEVTVPRPLPGGRRGHDQTSGPEGFFLAGARLTGAFLAGP